MYNKLNILFTLSVVIMLIAFGCDSVNSPNPGADVLSAEVSEAEAHTGTTVYVDANASGAGDGSSPADAYNTIQDGVDHANSGDVVELLSDFTTSEQVTINKSITLEGNNHSIDADFIKTSNSNNSAIGVQSDDVTIQNLQVTSSGDAPWPEQLTGINVYTSTGVTLTNITATDFEGSGILVNGSTVNASDITTANNGWHGINVDQGTGVTQPAVLNISNTSSHDENSPATASEFVDGESIPDIFIDDATDGTDATVNDIDDQYVSFEVDFRGGVAKVYTHYNSLSKDDCKKGSYANYNFKNQGQCIKFVNTGKK